MSKNEKGFTLIESLIVLSIFLIISSVTAFSLKPQYNMVDNDAFIVQLKADLLYAQQFAISHQRDVIVNIMAEKHMYVISESNSFLRIVERRYSEKINVVPGSISLYFKFLKTGNVDRFGSLSIQTNEKKYRMTVLIGRGRFYVVEE
ncbi:MAG: competence protein ComG [Neobacillus sp.]|jgi:competence protein ComGD|nr:competence protein ComG [Neobacillus sp.]